jgi:hypothetical protein
MNALRREWGAVTFVVTVLVGAIAVAISLIVAGAHAPPTPPLANCPSYTPYVATAAPSASPSTSATATPSVSPSTSASAAPNTSPGISAPASPSASAVETPVPTAFNPALANCPTAPLPPTSTPTATLPPGVTLPPTPTPVIPTPQFTPLPG